MDVMQGYCDSNEETDTKGTGMGVIQGYCDSKQPTDTKGNGMSVIQGYKICYTSLKWFVDQYI